MSTNKESVNVVVHATLSGSVKEGFVWQFSSNDVKVDPNDGAMTLTYPVGTPVSVVYTLTTNSVDKPYLTFINQNQNTSNDVGVSTHITGLRVIDYEGSKALQLNLIVHRKVTYGLILVAKSDAYPYTPILSPDPQVSNDPIPG